MFRKSLYGKPPTISFYSIIGLKYTYIRVTFYQMTLQERIIFYIIDLRAITHFYCTICWDRV